MITMEAKQIKAIREKLKMSQRELAEAIGVDQVTVNRWENKKSRPTRLAIRQLNRLARKVISNEAKSEITD